MHKFVFIYIYIIHSSVFVKSYFCLFLNFLFVNILILGAFI